MRNRPERRKTEPHRPFPLDSDLRPLVEAIASRQMILFAGGGISQSLGLPDFRTLISHISEETGFASGSVDMAD